MSGLAYPAGYVPGFDPSHPAAGLSPQVSAIATNGNFNSLLNGLVGTRNNSPTYAMDGRIGPSVNFVAASTQFVTLPGLDTRTQTDMTIAAIIVPQTSFSSHGAAIAYGATSGLALTLSSSGVLEAYWFGAVILSSGITLSLDTPYFVAISSKSAVGSNFVVMNLSTGQVQTAFASSGSSLTAPNTSVFIGRNGNDITYFSGLISAVMVASGKYLSRSQLLQWASDPWSYWYPGYG